MQEIIVTVSRGGKTTIDANGFEGTSCEEATQNIEMSLSGGRDTDKETKPEYHNPENTSCEVKRTF